MLARVYSCALVGLDGELVEVEVDVVRAENPTALIVGLPDTAVQEARERVRAAIRNSGLQWPANRRILVNLAPADLRKEGPAYDLAIAVGILAASGQLTAEVGDALFVGELGLEGAVRPVHGVLPMVSLAKQRGLRRAFVPAANAVEAALVEGVAVYPVESLASLAAHLADVAPIAPQPRTSAAAPALPAAADFADIVGQEQAKRALEVAAAGGHNVVMRGPPGAGKTLLARAVPSILPPMSGDEALEVTRIYSVAGLLPLGSGLMTARPFRAPHHTISHAGLVGGGTVPRPGEVTLSHRGVLFLDELPEFSPQVLEVLRQPLEDRVVTISRAKFSATFPANFMLVAAMNPCPCGYLGDPARDCRCPSQLVARYQRRISGPLLDRIDVFIDVPRVEYQKLIGAAKGEPSAAVAARVARARERQAERFSQAGVNIRLNAEMGPAHVRAFVQERMTDGAAAFLRAAVERLDLSARAFHRVLKLARTIADLAGSEAVEAQHIAEAVQYRARME